MGPCAGRRADSETNQRLSLTPGEPLRGGAGIIPAIEFSNCLPPSETAKI